MSGPPKCEARLRDGLRCGRYVDEPDGPETAKTYKTLDARELFICRACLDHAVVRAFGSREREYRLERNDPCPCQSGRKFKKCCMSKVRR